MMIHEITAQAGAHKKRMRVGRGESSGHGKTCGRGTKGSGARSGGAIKVGSEGGNMPLFRRLPKRGFNNARFATNFIPVNVEALNAFDDGTRVDEAVLRKVGLANGKSSGGVKILGDGKLSKKLTVVANAFSAGARKQIEALGGVCEAPAPKAA